MVFSKNASKNFSKTMIYCAFLDPESIAATDDGGGVGSDHVIGVMRNLLESCFLAETTSWTLRQEFLTAIRALADPDTRMKLNALVETFEKRDRFVEAINDIGSDGNVPLATVVVIQQTNPLLDIIITEQAPTNNGGVEFTAMNRFNRSNFSQKRQRIFADGIVLTPGKMSHEKLFEECFGRMLMHCDRFTIEDHLIGQDFKPNFDFNLNFWDAFFNTANRAISVTVLSSLTCLASKSRLENRLKTLSHNGKVTYTLQGNTQPRHERFFRSSAFSLNIGRGIDLCDKNGMNRDICVRFAK
ncbi:MAG: hypothetical protein EON58_08405 [Alphaproteobacteria bacterium]|nr:MAG: hypothetical protein EON58_08405 [Alphaproteobacteria bacterium]